jgi:uncharacterized membrane protein
MSLTLPVSTGTVDGLIFNSLLSLWPMLRAFHSSLDELQGIEINISYSATSSFLPSMTLPATNTPPTFTPSQSPTTSSAASRKQSKGAIIGESLGPALGALLIVIAGIILVWRWRRRKVKIEESEIQWGVPEGGKRTSMWY